MVSRYDNKLAWFQIGVSSVAAIQIMDSSSAARTPNQATSGIQIRNNDLAATVYVGYDNTATSGKWQFALGPGEALGPDDQRMGIGVSRSLWAIASAGTPNISVGVMS